MNANFQKFNRNDSPSIRKLRSRRIYDLAETTSSQTVDTAITTITSSNENSQECKFNHFSNNSILFQTKSLFIL